MVKKHKQWKPEQHEYGKVEFCTFTSQFKRLLFPRLRVPISTVIREDLHEIQQKVSTTDEYGYWSPRTRKGHSDHAPPLP